MFALVKRAHGIQHTNLIVLNGFGNMQEPMAVLTNWEVLQNKSDFKTCKLLVRLGIRECLPYAVIHIHQVIRNPPLNTLVPGPWFNYMVHVSYQCRKSHCGDGTVVRSSYLHNGISYTGIYIERHAPPWWLHYTIWCKFGTKPLSETMLT